MEFFGRNAPFVAANWPYITAILGVLLLFVIVRAWLSDKDEKVSKKIQSLEYDEHPLSEFKEEVLDPVDGTSLYSPDTAHVHYAFTPLTEDEMISRSQSFYDLLNKRRSIRHFSSKPVPLKVIQNIIQAAGTSPSGAHCEPWTFVVVRDQEVKSKIRNIIEQEEYLNYNHRMGDKWVQDLKFVQTDHEKAYLEVAPYIIIVFKSQYHIDDSGVRHSHYYYEISTAIASGILITAIHNAGLYTVTTTPLNAGGQLRELLGRPSSEKVTLVLPVGYPSDDATVPDVQRKELDDIMIVV